MPTTASLLKALSDKSNELHEKVRNFVAVWQGATGMLEHAGNFSILSSVVETSVIRDHSPPVERAAEEMRQSLDSLEPLWAPIIAMADRPYEYGLGEEQANQVRGRCQFTSGSIRQAQTFLEMFYNSRWYTESARRVPRLAAYMFQAPSHAAQEAVNQVTRTLAGPEYLAEQEEARRVALDLANQAKEEEGPSGPSIGGLVIGLGVGLIGVWFLRRRK
jgi:hypothetical protein